MGRSSKFSFPIPGRNRSSSKGQSHHPPLPTSKNSPVNLSKAEQILGTGTAEPGDWRRPGSRASRISISISESTYSTRSMNDNSGSCDQWDGESGVFGRQAGLKGGASSNALGQRYGEEIGTDTSSTTRRLRNADSTSTLKSHYDRHKLPATISQQTSASSSRDLALRKGLTPVVNRSSLLQVDSVDPYHQAGQCLQSINNTHLVPPERKGSVRSGLSSLFHRSERKRSTVSQNTLDFSKKTSLLRNRLVKAVSKESLQSQRPSIRSTKSRDRDQMPGQNHDSSSNNSYEQYEYYEESCQNARMNSIRESNIPELFNLFPTVSEKSSSRQPGSLNSEKREGHRRLEDLHSGSGERDASSWKNGNFRNSMISQSTGHSSLGISSTGSISSHNTKTSRQTGQSVFSSADLQQSSVLSLSSDSEDDLSDNEPLRSHDNMSIGKAPPHTESEIILSALQNRLSTAKIPAKRPSALKTQASKKGAVQLSAFLAIPESTGGLSDWPMPPTITRQDSLRSQDSRQASSHKRSSISSRRSIPPQPTPPLSPKDVDSENNFISDTSSGRMMQVTKQEEALLEALRKKRARMREKVIQEHEGGVGKSPPRLVAERASSRFSKASSTDTIRPGTERVPLYLDAPIWKERKLRYGDRNLSGSSRMIPIGIGSDLGQPKPDLCDYIAFPSEDDENTPTNSREASRADVRGNGVIYGVQSMRLGTPPPMDPRFQFSGC